MRSGQSGARAISSSTDSGRSSVPVGDSPIIADSSNRKEGKQSLRLSAREPSDAVLGQNLLLTPGGLYDSKLAFRRRIDLRALGGAKGMTPLPEAPAIENISFRS